MRDIVKYLTSTKDRQDVSFNLVSFGLVGILGLMMNGIIVIYYPSSVLGVFNQVYSIYILFSQIAVAGTHLSVLKYIPQNIDNTETQKVIFTSGIILTVLISALVSVTCALFSTPISSLLQSQDVAIGILYIIPGLFFFAIDKVVQAMLNGLREMKAFAIFQALRYILIFVLIFIICEFRLDSVLLPGAFSVAEILLFVPMILYVRKWLKFSSFSEIKKWIGLHFSFGMRAMIGYILLNVNSRIDVLVLGYFSSDSVVGVYSFAAILADGFYQLVMVLRNNVNPQLTQTYFESIEKFNSLIPHWKKISYQVFIPTGIVGMLAYPLITIVLNKPDYMSSWLPFALLMTGLLISVGFLPFQMVFNQTGYPGQQTLYIILCVGTNLILNIALIPFFGMIGSGLATGIAFTFQAIYLKVMAKRKGLISI